MSRLGLPTGVFLTALMAVSVQTPALSAETTIAVASNFAATAKEVVKSFAAKTGHRAVLAFGSTGKLYAQIANGAPFDAFLAADRSRPQRAEAEGLAVAGSRFTYATGRLVLYSADATRVDGAGKVLFSPRIFRKLAVANPKTAPYGAAAREVLDKLGVYENVKARIVQGDNVQQTYQFVATRNAELGFIAYSLVKDTGQGSIWMVPDSLYAPVRQDAVLLKKGEGNEAARAFIRFLQSTDARAIIERHGYVLN